MERQVFDNVWDALEETPERAAYMTAKSKLLMALEKQVRGWNATRAESAARLDVDQSRVTSILNGRINDFSVDELLVLAGKAGLTVQMDIRDAA